MRAIAAKYAVLRAAETPEERRMGIRPDTPCCQRAALRGELNRATCRSPWSRLTTGGGDGPWTMEVEGDRLDTFPFIDFEEDAVGVFVNGEFLRCAEDGAEQRR